MHYSNGEISEHNLYMLVSGCIANAVSMGWWFDLVLEHGLVGSQMFEHKAWAGGRPRV